MYDLYIVFIGSNFNYEYLMRTMKYSEEIMETKKNCLKEATFDMKYKIYIKMHLKTENGELIIIIH